jgi:uncharacterized membrane protein YkoI
MRFWILIPLALAFAAAAPASAQRFDARPHAAAAEARGQARQARPVPMSQVRQAVRQRYPGAEILDSWLRRDRNGNPVEYVVRIVTRDGRRLDVRVDARSGRVIG